MDSPKIVCPACGQSLPPHASGKLNPQVLLTDGLGRKEGSAGSSLLTITFLPCGHSFIVGAGTLGLIPASNPAEKGTSAEESQKLWNLTEQDTENITAALAKHQGKMDAIKFYKAYSGGSLKSALEYVEGVLEKTGLKLRQGCFVATACYGDENAREVVILRHFRDTVLLKSRLGTLWVQAYYAFSPPVARLLNKHQPLRVFVRKYLLETVIRWIAFFQKRSN